MLRFRAIDNVVVFSSLPNGESNRFIKAFIYRPNGSLVLGGDGSIPLTYVANGLYRSTTVFTMLNGFYKVIYKPYLDAGYTIPDDIYGQEEESLEIYTDAALDISTIEDKIDALSAQSANTDYEVEVDDDDTILEIQVDDDDSALEVEIENSDSDLEIQVDDDSTLEVELDESSEINVEIGE